MATNSKAAAFICFFLISFGPNAVSSASQDDTLGSKIDLGDRSVLVAQFACPVTVPSKEHCNCCGQPSLRSVCIDLRDHAGGSGGGKPEALFQVPGNNFSEVRIRRELKGRQTFMSLFDCLLRAETRTIPIGSRSAKIVASAGMVLQLTDSQVFALTNIPTRPCDHLIDQCCFTFSHYLQNIIWHVDSKGIRQAWLVETQVASGQRSCFDEPVPHGSLRGDSEFIHYGSERDHHSGRMSFAEFAWLPDDSLDGR